jgi:hypothetical protein
LNLKWLEGVSRRRDANKLQSRESEIQMDVTNSPIACSLPSGTDPGCGCAPKPTRSHAAKVAVITAGTAAACTACCVLPVTLPAVIVAYVGGTLTLLDRAHGWLTWVGIAAVIGAWLWIGRQFFRTRTKPRVSTLAMMAVATIVISLTASWPLLKPAAFQALGIAKKTSS